MYTLIPAASTILSLLALLVLACAPDRETEVSGEALFRHHCVSCHGPEGRGDGPLAAELRRPPADLTSLARAAGGEFDAHAVKTAIDGRRGVTAHGTREMPVWGVIFGAKHVGQPFYRYRSDQELDALTAYLHSLQTDGEEAE